MQKNSYLFNIHLHQVEERDQTLRYCSNCGRSVQFHDSYKRRQNANGKNVYEYAIYKCPKGHTWNKKLAIIKAEYTSPDTFLHAPEHYKIGEGEGQELEYSNDLILPEEQSISEISLCIESIQGRWRLDKAIASQLKGYSRERITEGIKQGKIKLNQICAKPSVKLKAGDIVSICFKTL